MQVNRCRCICVISAIMVLYIFILCGCGQKEPAEQEVSIFYHVEDGVEEAVGYGSDIPVSKETGSKSEKTVLTFAVSGYPGYDSRFKMVVDAFNYENEKYRVEMTTYHWGEELADAHTKIPIEIGSGGGPDILYEDVFRVNQSILDKGVLVDLTTYLEESGITEENYFPGYASIVSDGKIYGVTADSQLDIYMVDTKVLGGQEIPDFETFLDKLLAYPEKAGFDHESKTPMHVFMWLLKGSDTLGGSIDWERRTCDFRAPVFLKTIDVAKRYGEDNQAGYEPVVTERPLDFVALGEGVFDDPSRVSPVTYFDDGHYPMYHSGNTSLMINANTKHLEGAYAFLSYVMTVGQKYSDTPTRKATWEKQYQYYNGLAESGRINPPIELTSERKQLALDYLETGRFAPRRTEEIWDILFEEMEAYFEGTKSKEAVLDLIQNRVQLYLDEL